ncbi:MAG: ANTAR domain-containing response regulator [Dongiaceae bacterium]
MSSGAQIDYRQLRVVVAHPRDPDGDVLLRHLQRLGCRVDHLWPTPEALDADADVVFCLIEAETRTFCVSLVDKARAALVAVVDPANPKAMQLLADANPLAVLTKPVDPAALLTNLMVARNNSRYQRRLQSKISKLEETLKSVRKVERAKTILMEQRHIDESEAYAYLRDQAMRKRVPIGVVASVVVESNDVLSDEKD